VKRLQRLQRFLIIWLNHAALNAGALLACIYYGLIPPQWTGHKPITIDSLSKSNPTACFKEGTGWWGVRKPMSNKLTAEDRASISIIAVAPSSDTLVLIEIIERLAGEKITPMDQMRRKDTQ